MTARNRRFWIGVVTLIALAGGFEPTSMVSRLAAADRQSSDSHTPAKWAIPYEKAIDLIRKQQWEAAIPLLERAIAIDPNAAANKRVEATVTVDYFPQFYVLYAYTKLKQFDKARPYATAVRPARPVVSDAETVLAEYTIAQATEDRRASDADRGAADAGAVRRAAAERAAQKAAADRAAAERAARAAAEKIAADKAAADARGAADRTAVLVEFDALIARGNQALATKRFLDALTAYDAACAKLPDEFMKRGLQNRVDAVVRAMIAAPTRQRH